MTRAILAARAADFSDILLKILGGMFLMFRKSKKESYGFMLTLLTDCSTAVMAACSADSTAAVPRTSL
jgi:hypothetical protein